MLYLNRYHLTYNTPNQYQCRLQPFDVHFALQSGNLSHLLKTIVFWLKMKFTISLDHVHPFMDNNVFWPTVKLIILLEHVHPFFWCLFRPAASWADHDQNSGTTGGGRGKNTPQRLFTRKFLASNREKQGKEKKIKNTEDRRKWRKKEKGGKWEMEGEKGLKKSWGLFFFLMVTLRKQLKQTILGVYQNGNVNQEKAISYKIPLLRPWTRTRFQ